MRLVDLAACLAVTPGFQARSGRPSAGELRGDRPEPGSRADPLLQGGGGRDRGRDAGHGGLRHAEPGDSQRHAHSELHGEEWRSFLGDGDVDFLVDF